MRVVFRESCKNLTMTTRICFRVMSFGIITAIAILLIACGDSTNKKQQRNFRIGLVTNNQNGLKNIEGFRQGLAHFDYVEGNNVSYIFAGKPVPKDKLDDVIQGLIDKKVDLIFTAGTPTGQAAHRITQGTDIPVVFGLIADPISAGVLQNLTEPGGNMTGVRLLDTQARRLEWLLRIAPETKNIFIAYNPGDNAATTALGQIQVWAAEFAVKLVLRKASDKTAVIKTLTNMPEDVDAIFMLPDSVVNAHFTEIIKLAYARRIPVSAPSTIQVEQGALTTYGFIHEKVGYQAARIANQVLKGANPGTLPIEAAESFLVVNLKAAKAIGRHIPDDILREADIILRDDIEKRQLP